MGKVAIGVEMRSPQAIDGVAVNQLIERCPPLDTNSLYCNLLQCSHFKETCVVAEYEQSIVGFVSGYLIPERPEEVLFIWQVAVDPSRRGQGLAKQMIKHILGRPCSKGVTYLETTITDSNDSSWSMFESLARSLNTEVATQKFFDKQKHFAGGHESEMLLRIGPFKIANLD